MENLNDKSWYRFLKVIFIISFIVVQSFAIVSFWNDAPVKSFVKCDNGKILEYETYDISDNYYWAKKCDPNFVAQTSESHFKNLLDGLTWNLEYEKDYQATYLSLCVIFFIISMFFWLVARIFFYVVAKDKFLSGRLVDFLKKLLITK